jgi:glucosamine--fructose-6-phosphate aminotransferase (isomerizing)
MKEAITVQKFGQLTHPEITQQHEAIFTAWRQLEEQQSWINKYLADSTFDEVIFIGSGSSYYQALVMASTYRIWAGRPAAAYPSSEIYLFAANNSVPDRKYLLIGVSRSGESTEVILALESVKNLPQWTIAGISCYEESTLAKLAECLISPQGKEKSTVMTKSFSSMTFLMQASIAKAYGRDKMLVELQEAMALDQAIIQQSDRFIQNFVEKNHFNNYVFLGMGPYLGLAHEACLKIKEMAYVWTESFGTLEFRHGPKSIVEAGTLVCLLLSERARGYELKVAEEMKEYGATILLLTAKKGSDTSFADYVIELQGEQLTDEARAVLYLPPLQFLGYYTALKKQVDPDSPRNLTQVVRI